MNKTICKPFVLLMGLFFAPLPVFSNGGALEPPPGGPAPSMRTLDDIADAAEAGADPRVKIDAIPFVIHEPGSYVLTQNVQITEEDIDGIVITTDNVTLDLNGFTMLGPGDFLGTGRGIRVVDDRKNITIKNGMINDWGTQGIFARFCSNVSFQNLDLTANGGTGIVAGSGSMIKNVRSSGNMGYGVQMSEGEGGVMTNVVTTHNLWAGIFAREAVITRSVASDNGQHGIFNPEGVINNSVANHNALYGFSLGTFPGVIAFSSATGNQSGAANAENATLTGNTFTNN